MMPQIDASSRHDPAVTLGKSGISTLTWLACVGAVAVISVGTAVIIGWLFNIALLKSVLPGLATMKVNTACAFLAAGVALWFLNTSVPGSRSFRLARTLAVVVAVVGALTLAQDLFAVELGIDQLIISDGPRAVNAFHPGRMAPMTSITLVLVGLALLALKARRSRLAAFAHWFAIPPLFISMLSIIGYAYGVSSLYGVRPYATMALHTALTLFVLSLSLLAANPMYRLASIVASGTAGGVVCRRLLPTLPCILFALGWIRLTGQRAGLYGTEFGTALMVLFSITVCVLAVAGTAVTLHRVDITRKRSESNVISLNAGLELRVMERTQQLAELSAELSVANRSLEQLSLHDGLTDVANRRFFDTYLADQIGIAHRHKRPLALVLCDVDSFKAYNDHYGHLAGDECLKQVAGALRSCCHRPGDMVARYGGEEFAMVLPDTGSIGADQIAEAARDAIAQLRIPHAQSSTAAYVSISGGVAVSFLGLDMTSRQLISAADQSLYQAKHSGRNRMVSVDAGPG